MDVLTTGRFDVGPIQCQIELQELVGSVNVVEHILCGVKHDLSDSVFLDLYVFGAVTVTRTYLFLLRPVDLTLIGSRLERENHALFTS